MKTDETIVKIRVSSEEADASNPIVIASVGELGYEVGWKCMYPTQTCRDKESAIQVFADHFQRMIEFHKGDKSPVCGTEIAVDRWDILKQEGLQDAELDIEGYSSTGEPLEKQNEPNTFDWEPFFDALDEYLEEQDKELTLNVG